MGMTALRVLGKRKADVMRKRKEMASFANMHWYFSQERNQHPRFLLLIV